MNTCEVKAWLQWVHLTSIPLCKLEESDMPTGIASACLLNYRGRRFVLSASHAVKLGSNDWVLDLGPDNAGRTEIYKPSLWFYNKEFHRADGSIVDVDFCAAEIALDVLPHYQQRTPNGLFSDSQQCHMFDVRDIAQPIIDETYAFAGKIDPEMHGQAGFLRQPIVYPGLKYNGGVANRLEFTLPVDHPGHDAFRGCSGAPIVDTQRRVVALVSGGDRANNLVYGVALQTNLYAIDFYCDQLRPSENT